MQASYSRAPVGAVFYQPVLALQRLALARLFAQGVEPLQQRRDLGRRVRAAALGERMRRAMQNPMTKAGQPPK